MDVTPQILQSHIIYGGSDSTKQNYISSSRCLNYGKGASIQNPEKEKISTAPLAIEYKDAVGLFGAENHFVKLVVSLQEPLNGDYNINSYDPAFISEETIVATDEYTFDPADPLAEVPGQAVVHYELDNDDDGSCGSGVVCWNDYEPVKFSLETIPGFSSKYFKIELKNLKTGNMYIDSWLDVRLYNKQYDEHPYDVMYVKYNEPFYIGFHARNTKRLPYNVVCEVGQPSDNPELPAFADLGEFDYRLLATKR